MGVLGWPPSEFWAASLPELLVAYEGYKMVNGSSDRPKPMLRKGFDALKKKLGKE